MTYSGCRHTFIFTRLASIQYENDGQTKHNRESMHSLGDWDTYLLSVLFQCSAVDSMSQMFNLFENHETNLLQYAQPQLKQKKWVTE